MAEQELPEPRRVVAVEEVKTEEDAELFLYQLSQVCRCNEIVITLDEEEEFKSHPDKLTKFIYTIKAKLGDHTIEVTKKGSEDPQMAYINAILEIDRKVQAYRLVNPV